MPEVLKKVGVDRVKNQARPWADLKHPNFCLFVNCQKNIADSERPHILPTCNLPTSTNDHMNQPLEVLYILYMQWYMLSVCHPQGNHRQMLCIQYSAALPSTYIQKKKHHSLTTIVLSYKQVGLVIAGDNTTISVNSLYRHGLLSEVDTNRNGQLISFRQLLKLQLYLKSQKNIEYLLLYHSKNFRAFFHSSSY